jgi:hypothetical protein
MLTARIRAIFIILTVILVPWTVGCPWAFSVGTSDETGDTSETTVTSKWCLWSKGKTYLRGANIWQRTTELTDVYGVGTLGDGTVGPPFTQDDFDRLAALGANYVNISHPGLYTVDPPYQLDEGIQANLDNLLSLIGKADMFAVITFRTGPGRSEFAFAWGEDTTADPDEGWFDASYYNNTVWESQDAQDAWAAMWGYAAERYRTSSVVVGYDLMCEPNPEEVFFDIWGEPNEFYPQHAGTLYDWNQFYPDIVTAIRAVDTKTPILVQPMGYGAVAWLPYLAKSSEARIVYTCHQYLPTGYTHQLAAGPSVSYPGTVDGQTANQAYLDNLLQTIDGFQSSSSVAVAVNEFGPVRYAPNADDYLDDLIGLFEDRALNHALWEWGASWPGYIDNDAFSFRHGADPNNHTDVTTSDLIEVLKKYWGRNTLRPSTTAFST